MPGDASSANTEIGSVIYANRPGDGSAREQAASCQRVIGGLANIVHDYATKRYRSNVINWGMIPFQLKTSPEKFEIDDYIYIPEIKKILEGDYKDISAYVIRESEIVPLNLYVKPMTEEEKEIIKSGCLINYNRRKRKEH